jgi:hypothetical protein
MSKELKVKIGKALSESEAKSVDHKKVSKQQPKPPHPPVEGQWRDWEITVCPTCGYAGWSELDTETYLWVQCGVCPTMWKA